VKLAGNGIVQGAAVLKMLLNGRGGIALEAKEVDGCEPGGTINKGNKIPHTSGRNREFLYIGITHS